MDEGEALSQLAHARFEVYYAEREEKRLARQRETAATEFAQEMISRMGAIEEG